MSVPLLPGVPPLKETLSRGLISTGLVMLSNSRIDAVEKEWAIYGADGSLALTPDSFLGVDYKDPSRVADYPIEKGGFSSYNKVQEPYTASVTLAKGGTLFNREEFIKQMEKLKKSTDLLSIKTPEKVFLSCNIEHCSYSRTADSGANLIIATLHFREIIDKPTIRYSQTRSGKEVVSTVPEKQMTQPTTSTGVASPSNTKNPASQGTINNGSVSTTDSRISIPSL